MLVNKMINMLVSKNKTTTNNGSKARRVFPLYTSIIRSNMWHSRKDLAWSGSICLVSRSSLHFLFKTSTPRTCGLQCSYSRMLNLNRWLYNAWCLCSVTLSPKKIPLFFFCHFIQDVKAITKIWKIIADRVAIFLNSFTVKLCTFGNYN